MRYRMEAFFHTALRHHIILPLPLNPAVEPRATRHQHRCSCTPTLMVIPSCWIFQAKQCASRQQAVAYCPPAAIARPTWRQRARTLRQAQHAARCHRMLGLCVATQQLLVSMVQHQARTHSSHPGRVPQPPSLARCASPFASVAPSGQRPYPSEPHYLYCQTTTRHAGESLALARCGA